MGLLTLLATILFCGISRDSEFYEPTIFVKHRPTIKVHFYTPTGESDMTLSDLTDEGKKEEILYREFIEEQKVYSDNLNRLWFLPPVLIQLTLTFLSFGSARQNAINPSRLPIHVLMNLVPTTVIVSLMLFSDNLLPVFGLTAILGVVNVWTIKLVQRKRTAQQKI